MGVFDLPSQRVICPKCKDDYFSDGSKQVCPYCKHEFTINQKNKEEEK